MRSQTAGGMWASKVRPKEEMLLVELISLMSVTFKSLLHVSVNCGHLGALGRAEPHGSESASALVRQGTTLTPHPSGLQTPPSQGSSDPATSNLSPSKCFSVQSHSKVLPDFSRTDVIFNCF